MKLFFVIVNYNGSEMTIRLIKSIENINNLDNYEVIVVDNDSEPLQKEILKGFCTQKNRIRLIFEKSNIGYFNAINIGLNFIKRSEASWVLIGNNDLEFDNNFFDRLKEIHKEIAQYPVISPNIVRPDGEHQNPHVIKSVSSLRKVIYKIYYSNYCLAKVIGILSRITSKYTYRKDRNKYLTRIEIKMGYGACYLLSPRFFSLFKKLNSPLFLMGEEAILSNQICSIGEKILYEPSLVVKHIDHGSINKIPNKKIWTITKNSYEIYKNYL